MQKKKLDKNNMKNWNKYKYMLLSIITIIVFIIAWETVVSQGIISNQYLPKPSQVIGTFLEKLKSPNPEGATLVVNILASLKVALAGFLMAIIFGIPLGLIMGWYEPIDRCVAPIFEVIRPIPPVAWIPITILFLGIGFKAKMFIIFFSAFVPCVINAYAGIKMTNKTLINVAKTYGANNFTIFMKVGIPSSVNMIFTGIRIALGTSWTTLVAAEMLAADAGLGYMILMGRQFARPDIIVLGMIIIGLFGALFSSILEYVERKIENWRIIR